MSMRFRRSMPYMLFGLMCVSVQYLQRPVAVLTDVARVLRPGAPVVISFSNRCFPTKAVAIWNALDGAGHVQLVGLYLQRAGFARIERTGRHRRDPGTRRNVRDVADNRGPVRPGVLSHMHETIVRTHPDDLRIHWRLAD